MSDRAASPALPLWSRDKVIDVADVAEVLPLLKVAQVHWLGASLERVHAGHAWLAELSEPRRELSAPGGRALVRDVLEFHLHVVGNPARGAGREVGARAEHDGARAPAGHTDRRRDGPRR